MIILFTVPAQNIIGIIIFLTTVVIIIREAIRKRKAQDCGPFPYGGGGAQPHSVAFGGVFPNITEAILVDEISTKVRIYPPKVIT